jgi:hypothetical protein
MTPGSSCAWASTQCSGQDKCGCSSIPSLLCFDCLVLLSAEGALSVCMLSFSKSECAGVALLVLLAATCCFSTYVPTPHCFLFVSRSWNIPRAVKYREINKITGLRGTAVNVQTMVYGNINDNSGTGVGCFGLYVCVTAGLQHASCAARVPLGRCIK